MKFLSSLHDRATRLGRIAAVAATLLCALAAYATAVGEVENVHLKNRTRYVSDMAGVLSPQAIAMGDSLLSQIWQTSTAEPVVVVVPDLDGEEINDYATELFTRWGIGKKDRDNGVLVLVSINDRQAAIRTGYGAEGVLPDALCWGIIRNDMLPHFKEGDYDQGVLASLASIHKAMTDPEAREELMSAYANDANASGISDDDIDGEELWKTYLGGAVAVSLIMLAFVFWAWYSGRGKDTEVAYRKFSQLRLPALMASFVTLGGALPALLLILFLMRRTRLRKRLCPNCSHPMERLDEETDNRYLTPAQDTEEHLNSVDYDVWLCPNCGETDIIPYVNPNSNYSVCERCGAKAKALVEDRIVRHPTEHTEGYGVRTYECRHCHNRTNTNYRLPRKTSVAPIIIPGGGGGFGSGGGFSGGSFGGGMTGGGGSTGSW